MSNLTASQVDSAREVNRWHAPEIVRTAEYALLVGAAYYLGAKLGFALTFQPHPVSALWPPNAILLAALLLAPTRWWWTFFLAAFTAHLVVGLPSGAPIALMLSWFVSNSAEALMGAICIRHFIAPPIRLNSFRRVCIFLCFAVVLAPLLTSFLDAAFVKLSGWKNDGYWLVWRMRLFSNALAALTIIPVL